MDHKNEGVVAFVAFVVAALVIGFVLGFESHMPKNKVEACKATNVNGELYYNHCIWVKR